MSGPLEVMRSVRVGIVGAGYIASVHSAAWRAVSGTFLDPAVCVSLAAVADEEGARADSLSSAWGWARACTNWRDITRGDDVDVVDVCVPNHLHEEVAIDALEHGKHVVCEKPLAINPESARRMVKAAEDSGCKAQVCFYYRLWPAIAWARKLVHEGAIGEIQHFRGWMLQDYASDVRQAMGWRLDRRRAGAGALGDLGSHIVDIARSFAGDLQAVCAITRSTVDRQAEDETDDLAAALVRFRSGASGVLEASWAMRGHECDLGFDVVGTRGAVRFGWERANEIEVLTLDEPDSRGFRRVLVGPGVGESGSFIAVPGQGLGYRDAFTIGLGRLVRALGDDAACLEPSFQDGLRVAETIGAIQASAASGTWQEVAGPS